MKTEKTFDEVVVGDEAYNCEEQTLLEGKVIWKGSLEELRDSDYSYLIDSEWDEMLQDSNLVVVEESEYSQWGSRTVYNYNEDPCGVVSFK